MAKKKQDKNIPLFNLKNLKSKSRLKAATLLTPQEVADRLRLKRSTVWRYIREGKIKAIKFNQRTYRVLERDLNQFLRKCRRS
jgi:excisionase family DNA binding protein